MSDRFDVLGIGCAAVDELLFVESYPEPDVKTRVTRTERRFGGLTGAALIAASRFGARCAYAGRLGLDESSRAVDENLKRNGVDTALAPRSEAFGVVRSTIVVGMREGTRNVFSIATGATGAHETLPESAVIQRARALFVDHHGIPGAIRAATIARGAGVPVVADLEKDEDGRFTELLALVNHLVLPERFARRVSGAATAAEACRKLWNAGRAAVVVTCGADGCWFFDGAAAPEHAPALSVAAGDTTGCGDVFHGVYAAALAAGLPLRERIRYATAAAGLKAGSTAGGGGDGIPDRKQLDEALAVNGRLG